MRLGERIAQIRNSKGITQTFIAGKLNKTPQWLSNIEKGRRVISAEELNELAKILDVDVSIFFKEKLNEAFIKASDIQAPTGTDGGK